MKQGNLSGDGMGEATGRRSFRIEGTFCGDKTLPSLNQYIAEIGTHPRRGGQYKRQYVMIITSCIRRDLKRWKASGPVILHYVFAEPKKGQKRDRMNIFSLADKFIEDALRDCKVIADDDPEHVINCTHEFIYTDGVPYIAVEIEEIRKEV